MDRRNGDWQLNSTSWARWCCAATRGRAALQCLAADTLQASKQICCREVASPLQGGARRCERSASAAAAPAPAARHCRRRRESPCSPAACAGRQHRSLQHLTSSICTTLSAAHHSGSCLLQHVMSHDLAAHGYAAEWTKQQWLITGVSFRYVAFAKQCKSQCQHLQALEQAQQSVQAVQVAVSRRLRRAPRRQLRPRHAPCSTAGPALQIASCV